MDHDSDVANRRDPWRRARSLRAGAAMAGLAAVALVAAACGGGAKGPGVASAGGTSTMSAAAGAGGTSTTAAAAGVGGKSTTTAALPGPRGPGIASAYAEALKFSQCMRSHGVTDFPDPSATGGIPITYRPNSDLNPDNPTFQAAENACKTYRPHPKMTPAQFAQGMTQALKDAKCMRSHGVPDFPDPTTGPNGGPGFHLPSVTGDLDPNSPVFQRASKACERITGVSK